MAFLVEDGTGLPNSNSYAAVADADAYFSDRAIAAWTGATSNKEGALIRATAFIDATFRAQFPGYRALRRAQALEWPRSGAYYLVPYDPGVPTRAAPYNPGYDYIAPNVIPIELRNATCEAALRELATPGWLAPDLDANGPIKMQRAGDTQIEYASGATLSRTFPALFLVLGCLLHSNHGFSARAVRG